MEGESPSRKSLASISHPFTHPQDEAFLIWSEWASFYAPGSEERRFLEGIRDQRWLVSLVHHDFMDPSALWTFMFKGENSLL